MTAAASPRPPELAPAPGLAHSTAPIGIFDSGIGGLSVLLALRHELPHEHFIYLADSAHAPYGERSASFVRERTLRITAHLHQHYGIKALVMACNTATAAAADALRQHWPQLPIIGVEPAIKPAAALTRTGHVGVMATRGTVTSARFARLLQDFGAGVQWHIQPCDGLAHAIEAAACRPPSDDAPSPPPAPSVAQLCQHHTQALGQFGTGAGQIDTLVLGCTHYVFAREVLQTQLGPSVQLLDTGAAVARQTRRVLHAAAALAPEPGPDHPAPQPPHILSTGAVPELQRAVQRWLHLPRGCCASANI